MAKYLVFPDGLALLQRFQRAQMASSREMLDFNHGISVTNAPNDSIKPTFVQGLRDIFEGCKGEHSLTLSFWVTGDPQQFKPDSGAQIKYLMALAQGGSVFQNVSVQVVQIPKTLDRLPEA
ncbi:unnamed protein product [Effrenium voratum]|nr:unnamed protein product [Effrenium voratum]